MTLTQSVTQPADGVNEDIGALSGDLAAASLALARRFAGNATLWCAAPAWPSHAHHMAVEFVHPVVVGKRALPAVALPGASLPDELRVMSKPGDVVALVAHDSPEMRAAMRRASVFGMLTLWLGAGPRPPAGSADHVLWLEEDQAIAAYSGRFVLLYHVLWELTHVCFEHPGLLAEPDSECEEEVCITCSDEGRLAEVLEVGDRSSVRVRTSSGMETVDASLIEAPCAGDLLMVHAGTAIERIEDATGSRHE